MRREVVGPAVRTVLLLGGGVGLLVESWFETPPLEALGAPPSPPGEVTMAGGSGGGVLLTRARRGGDPLRAKGGALFYEVG